MPKITPYKIKKGRLYLKHYGFSEFMNRVRDRLTVLIPPAGKQRADYGLNADGTGEIIWEDGSRHFSSVDYVHQKDAHFHTAAETALKGSKMRSGDFR